MPQPEDLSREIVRNIVPFNAGEDIAGIYQPIENTVMELLRTFGILPPKAPGPRDPLPKYDPKTGRIIQPGERGY